jgi:hypothetical protein
MDLYRMSVVVLVVGLLAIMLGLGNMPVGASTLNATEDVSVELSWASSADLDLIVTTPDGQLITYSSPTAGGGTLVADANGFCHNDGSAAPVEQVVLPSGIALSGQYHITVSYALVCGDAVPVEWELVIRNGGNLSHYSGQLVPGETAPVESFALQ